MDRSTPSSHDSEALNTEIRQNKTIKYYTNLEHLSEKKWVLQDSLPPENQRKLRQDGHDVGHAH